MYYNKVLNLFFSEKKSNFIHTQIDVVAFDKTGTLTEEGLDLQQVVPAKNAEFSAPVDSENVAEALDSSVLSGLAACHSLTHINGDLCGDPLDLILFKATEWKLNDPEVSIEFLFVLVVINFC